MTYYFKLYQLPIMFFSSSSCYSPSNFNIFIKYFSKPAKIPCVSSADPSCLWRPYMLLGIVCFGKVAPAPPTLKWLMYTMQNLGYSPIYLGKSDTKLVIVSSLLLWLGSYTKITPLASFYIGIHEFSYFRSPETSQSSILILPKLTPGGGSLSKSTILHPIVGL